GGPFMGRARARGVWQRSGRGLSAVWGSGAGRQVTRGGVCAVESGGQLIGGRLGGGERVEDGGDAVADGGEGGGGEGGRGGRWRSGRSGRRVAGGGGPSWLGHP